MRKTLSLTLALLAIFGFIFLAAPGGVSAIGHPIDPVNGCEELNTLVYPVIHITGTNAFTAGQQISITGTNVHFDVDYAGGSFSQFFNGTFDYTFTDNAQYTSIFAWASGTLADVRCIVNTNTEENPGFDPLFHDARLNWMDPHAPVVFYATAEGMVVYAGDNSGLVLAVYVTPSDKTEALGNVLFLGTDMATVPDENLLLWSGELNGVKAEFWRLSSGAYQFMLGPDESGDVYVKVFDAMRPTTIENLSFNIYDENKREW